MIFLDGCFGRQFCGWRRAEIVFDLGFEIGLIAFQRQQKISFKRDDFGGDINLTPHSVNRHQSPFDLPCFGKMIEKFRDGRNLIGFFRHAELGQSQASAGGIGAERVKRFQAFALIMRATGRFSVDVIKSCRPGQSTLIQSSKQRPNKTGSTQLTKVRSQRSQGMPW